MSSGIALKIGVYLSLMLGVGTAFGQDSSTNGAPTRPPFVFSGGSPEEFIGAVQKYFKLDWHEALRLPPVMQEARLPKMTISTEDPFFLLNLYNQVSGQIPNLGTWAWEHNPENPFFIVLVPDAPRAAALMERRADSVISISMRNVPRPLWDRVTEEVESLRALIEEAAARLGQPSTSANQATVDARTGTLIVRGSLEFREKARGIVESHFEPEAAKRMEQELRIFQLFPIPPPEWPAVLDAIDQAIEEGKTAAAKDARLYFPEGKSTLDQNTHLLFALGTSDYNETVRQAVQTFRERRAAELSRQQEPAVK